MAKRIGRNYVLVGFAQPLARRWVIVSGRSRQAWIEHNSCQPNPRQSVMLSNSLQRIAQHYTFLLEQFYVARDIENGSVIGHVAAQQNRIGCERGSRELM